jgi:DNA-binding LacI/PurR family transcriptional regulator
VLGASNERFVDERKYDRMLRSGQVDGLLLLEPTLDQPYLRDLAAEDRAVVIVNGDGASLGLDSVRTDDFAVGALAGDHLCELGHTRIGMIMGSPNHASARDRLAGFRASLERHELSLNERRTFQGYYESSEESGREGICKILSDQPDTTAVFCCNDTMAQWALQGAVEMERPVPDSLSLIGVDDNPISAYSRPALASVRQPSRDIARVATEILLKRLAGSGASGSREVLNRLLPPTLIPRDSCAPPH